MRAKYIQDPGGKSSSRSWVFGGLGISMGIRENALGVLGSRVELWREPNRNHLRVVFSPPFQAKWFSR